MSFPRRALLALAAVLTATACAPAKKPAEPLRFSILSTENSAAQQVKWTPFLQDLSKTLGREIKPYYASSYAPLVEAMRFKQTDIGWFSNQSGLEAVRRGGGEVFARTTHPDGARGYRSVIVVRRGSGITLDKLLTCERRYSFGMGDAKSTSGTLAPHAWLFGPKDIDPQTCFSAVRSASHEANLLGVANGVVDAATNNTNDMERLARRKDPAAAAALAQLQVVWTSPPLPEDPMVWRKDLDAPTRQAVRAAILAYGRGTGAEAERRLGVLHALNFGLFEPATDDHLLAVRELEAADNLLRTKRSGDAKAVAAAQAALAEVRARLAKAA